MNIDEINRLTQNKGVIVKEEYLNNKASERYLYTEIIDNNTKIWEGYIPYFYRRTGLMLTEDVDIANYLLGIKNNFYQTNIEDFKKAEKQRWEKQHLNKTTTKSFFDALIGLEWLSQKELPPNPNWARRMQDIKELGYTITTVFSNPITKESGTFVRMLPLSPAITTGYEIISENIKKTILKILKKINAYENNEHSKNLIPDHKFPEIRWDENTRKSNNNLTEEELKDKFQLLDNQRNQQKREVCRKCFQEGKRGMLFGIKYFYEGNENWDAEVPKTGKDAEKGCIGCGWYDIQKWRESLNQLILREKEEE